MPPWFNAANLLTVVRLLLTPLVIQAILAGRHRLALAVFAVAAATDLADGIAARRLGLATQAGAYLDPVADKCLLSGVYLALAAAGIIPWWLVMVIFGRDLYILAGVAAVMWFTTVRKFPPSVWGKVSTLVQIVTAVAWMARNSLEFRMLDWFSSAMLWPCAVFTVWSGIHYTWRGIRITLVH
jgi:cardiolipin synthase